MSDTPSDTLSPDPQRMRWIPNALLDLPPLEPVFALRTPHRIALQAMPSSRDVLAKLLEGPEFEIQVELDSREAPLQHVPIHDVHEARLTPDLPLEWATYYWILDGLQADLGDWPQDPGTGLAQGRARLETVEQLFRAGRRYGVVPDLVEIREAWHERAASSPAESPGRGDPQHTLRQYVRGLSSHLVAHASSLAFSDWAADLLGAAESTPGLVLPRLGERDQALVSLYLQHRLFGNAWLTSPAGMVAGWHVLISAWLLAVWFAGLLVHTGYERQIHEALLGSLWMIDQGFWRDEPLVHDLLQNLNASEYTAADLAYSLTDAMRSEQIRA